MKNKKLFAYALALTLGVGALGTASVASAHGFFGMMGSQATPEEIASRHQSMFQAQANLLGVSVDEVKAAWAQGKTMLDLAKEKGISEETLQTKMKAQRTEQVKTQLQNLVSKGVITQAQADQRLQFMQSNQPQGGRGGKMGMGMMRGLGF